MRHKLILILLLISFPLFAQQQDEDSTLFFGNTPLNHAPMTNFMNGWYVTPGESFVDSITTYNGQNSLCLTSSTTSPSLLFAGYYIRMDDIEADSIAFEGKYKFDPDNDAGFYIVIQQYFNNPTNSFKDGTKSFKYMCITSQKVQESGRIFQLKKRLYRTFREFMYILTLLEAIPKSGLMTVGCILIINL